MTNLGLMTEEEVKAAVEFNVTEEVSVDAMAWSWSIAAKVALGVASAFL